MHGSGLQKVELVSKILMDSIAAGQLNLPALSLILIFSGVYKLIKKSPQII